MDTGRAVHDEQKAENVTRLKGPTTLQAYREQMDERVKEAAANKMTYQEQLDWYNRHPTVAQAAEAANLMRDTQNMFGRTIDPWTFYCHLCKKNSDEAHLASAAHRAAVELSANISWMCGGLQRSLRAPRLGAPTAGLIGQERCRAWWGPRAGNARA